MTTRVYSLQELEAMDREETSFDPASIIATALHYCRMSPADLNDKEMHQPADGDEDMSVSAIMSHTTAPRDTALMLYRALKEAEVAFNSAKKANTAKVTISRASLWRLIVLAGAQLGMTTLAGGRR